MIAVSVRNLVKRYKTMVAVDSVSLEVEQGEFITLLGPSGCGKTTTLRSVAGFVQPDSGQILLSGKDVTDLPPHLRNIGMVFQSHALFPHMTVAGNVGYGLQLRGMAKTTVANKVAEALELVRLSGLGNRRIKELSGGQQQRVALARALVYEPSVLLLDEPLSALDAKLRTEMRAEMRALQKRLGMTTIFVTHDQEEALSISDRIAIMNAGRIEQVGTPVEVYDRPHTPFVAKFIGVSNILDAVVESVSGTVSTVRLRPGITVSVEALQAMEPGGEACVVVRPEHIRLSTPDSTASGPGLTGRVATATLLGPVIRYEVAIEDDLRITVDALRHGSVAYRPGESVRLAFDRASALPKH